MVSGSFTNHEGCVYVQKQLSESMDIMVAPEAGTDLVPMERWSVGCDDLDGELGSGFWQSAQVECLCSQIHFVKGKEGSDDQGTT